MQFVLHLQAAEDLSFPAANIMVSSSSLCPMIDTPLRLKMLRNAWCFGLVLALEEAAWPGSCPDHVLDLIVGLMKLAYL